MGVLQQILASKRNELSALRAKIPVSDLAPRSFSLRRDADQLRLLCEIKFRSPSAGALSTALSVQERARVYAEGGASLISVLVDEPFFGGSWENLQRARAACNLPLLAKEFVVDECQLDAAAAFGADAVLLIVRCLTPPRLQTLHDEAVARGLTPIVEVHQETELDAALRVGATVIGVNARDLDTLEMNPAQARQTINSIPRSHTALYLSGTREPADITSHVASRADGVLIGECLMRQDNPGALLQEFAQAAAAG